MIRYIGDHVRILFVASLVLIALTIMVEPMIQYALYTTGGLWLIGTAYNYIKYRER